MLLEFNPQRYKEIPPPQRDFLFVGVGCREGLEGEEGGVEDIAHCHAELQPLVRVAAREVAEEEGEVLTPCLLVEGGVMDKING